MAILLTSVISSLSCLLQAVAPTWGWMLVFRFILGIFPNFPIASRVIANEDQELVLESRVL